MNLVDHRRLRAFVTFSTLECRLRIKIDPCQHQHLGLTVLGFQVTISLIYNMALTAQRSLKDLDLFGVESYPYPY